VRSAVYLDDQSFGQTSEVHDEKVDGDLLTELEPDLFQLTQSTPQPALSVGPIPA
jgi:hypothetical protein